MNSLSATGNLGNDCEIRFTQTGKALTSFSVAIKSGWGEREKTTWVNCTLWGRGGDAHPLSPYLLKGQLVGVVGEIYLDEYEKDGEKRKSLKMDVRGIDLLGKKGDNPSESKPAQAPLKENDYPDDDIPW